MRSHDFTGRLGLIAVLVAASARSPGQAPTPPTPPVPAPVAGAPAPLRAELKEEADDLADSIGSRFQAQVEGKHFDFVGALTPAQAGPILEAAESALKLFQSWTEASAYELFGSRKCLIVVAPSKKEFVKIGPWYEKRFKAPYAASGLDKVSYWPFDEPRCLIATHLKPHDAATVRQIVVHEIGHLLVSRYRFNNNFSPTWLLEGMGAYLEARVTGLTNCYCFAGGYGGSGIAAEKLNNLQWSKWKTAVKAEAKSGVKPMKQILPMSMSDLTAVEVAKAWSVIDYMVTTDPKKFAKWLGRVKSLWPKKVAPEWSADKLVAQEKALQEVFGFDFATLDEEWRKHVAKY